MDEQAKRAPVERTVRLIRKGDDYGDYEIKDESGATTVTRVIFLADTPNCDSTKYLDAHSDA